MGMFFFIKENQPYIYFDEDIRFDVEKYAQGTIYDWSYKDTNSFLYTKRARLSLLINLTNDSEEIFKQFKSNTRNEINKAKALDFKIEYDMDINNLLNMHNQMLKSKGLKEIDKTFYLGKWQKPIITSVSSHSAGGVLVAHSYIVNESRNTVFLYSSVSDFRNMDSEKRKVIGYANRYLTYKDILYFKENGFEYYDLGCIGFEDEYLRKEPRIWPIVQFKKSFGGEIVKYYEYIPSCKRVKKICKIIINIKNLIKGNRCKN